MITIDPIKKPFPNIFGNSSVDMTEIFNKVDKKLEEFKNNIPSDNGVPIVDSEDKLNPNAPLGSLGVVAYNTKKSVSIRDLYQPTMDDLDMDNMVLPNPEKLSKVDKLEFTFPEGIHVVDQIEIVLIPRTFGEQNQKMLWLSFTHINDVFNGIIYEKVNLVHNKLLALCEYDENGIPSVYQENIDALNTLLTTDDWCYFSNPENGFVITDAQFDIIDKFFKVVSESLDTTLYINKPEGYKSIFDSESAINDITGDEKILINNNGKLSTITITLILDNTNTRLNLLEMYSDGVYAVTADGKLIDYNSADATAIGVALVVGEHKFMIAKADATDGTNTTLYWGKNLYQQDVPNLENIDNETAAKVDYNGKANTSAIIAGYAALGVEMDSRDMCKVLETYNEGGYTDWYVPASGQLLLMCANRYKINEALTVISGDALLSDIYLSSSEVYSRECWYVDLGYGNIDWISKNASHYVRFIRDIPSIQKRISNLELNTYTKSEIDNMIISTLNTEV